MKQCLNCERWNYDEAECPCQQTVVKFVANTGEYELLGVHTNRWLGKESRPSEIFPRKFLDIPAHPRYIPAHPIAAPLMLAIPIQSAIDATVSASECHAYWLDKATTALAKGLLSDFYYALDRCNSIASKWQTTLSLPCT